VNTIRYVRKPLYVDVVEVTKENFQQVAKWCQGNIVDDYIHVRVHNPKTTRQSHAYIGDWILYTARGYKVYTTKAFENSFDLCEPSMDRLPWPDLVHKEVW